MFALGAYKDCCLRRGAFGSRDGLGDERDAGCIESGAEGGLYVLLDTSLCCTFTIDRLSSSSSLETTRINGAGFPLPAVG